MKENSQSYYSKFLVFAVLLSLLLINSCSTPYQVVKPTKTPREISSKEHAIISDGIKLHDQGDYSEAIEKYKEALQINPENITAIYEIAYSFSSAGRLDSALKYSEIGMEYSSPLLDMFYMMAANNLDDMGREEDAISLYQSALNMSPENYMLYLNLGITRMRHNLPGAEECFIKTITLNPEFASPHFHLGNYYNIKNKKYSALFSYLRFLILEPNTARTEQTLNQCAKIMFSGVTQSPGDNNRKQININIGMSSLESEFMFIEFALKINQAALTMEIDSLEGDSTGTIKNVINDQINKNKTLYNRFESAISSVFGIMGNKEYESFSGKYYSPYFSEISRKEYVEVFTNLILSYTSEKEVNDWIYDNEDKIKEFKDWSESFEWYEPKKINLDFN